MYLPLTQKVVLSSTSVFYAVMFFLGYVTRYNPDFFDPLMDDKEQWLISEFLKSITQSVPLFDFLYGWEIDLSLSNSILIVYYYLKTYLVWNVFL